MKSSKARTTLDPNTTDRTFSGRHPTWSEVVESFPEKARADIDSIQDNHGCLPAAAVGRLLGSTFKDMGSLMMSLLPLAQKYAVVPVSHYQVGAVAAGMPIYDTGWANLYLGANFEFANAALSFTVHGEQSATNHAWLRGEAGIQKLAISAAPCGYCRQFLYELVTAKSLAILLPDPNDPSSYISAPLTDFLPSAFGPEDLRIQSGLMDLTLEHHYLALPGGEPTDPVIVAAMAAACASYAPYPTDTAFGYAGVAIQLSDNSIYAGRNAENAAYNPSLSPLESALSFMNMSRPLGSSAAVVRCVLVEVPTLSSQFSATNTVLAAYSPDVSLEYFAASVVL